MIFYSPALTLKFLSWSEGPQKWKQIKLQTEESWVRPPPKAKSCRYTSPDSSHIDSDLFLISALFTEIHIKTQPSRASPVSYHCTLLGPPLYSLCKKSVSAKSNMSSLLKYGFFNHHHYHFISNVLSSSVYISECFCWQLFAAGMIKIISLCNCRLFLGSCIDFKSAWGVWVCQFLVHFVWL